MGAIRKCKLALPIEVRFPLPSPPWFEIFQVAFLWECMASGQSDSRGRENVLHYPQIKAPSNVLHQSHYSYWFALRKPPLSVHC